MYAIYDHNSQVAIWWSTKCGCSTIKNLYYNYLLKRNLDYVHVPEAFGCQPQLFHYKNVVTVRNPYDRIVSCFLDKYVNHRTREVVNIFLHRTQMPIEKFTFAVFIEYLHRFYCRKEGAGLTSGEVHHTTPQFSEAYSEVVSQHPSFKFDVIHQLEFFNPKEFLASIGYPVADNIDVDVYTTNVAPHEKCLSVSEAAHLSFDDLLNNFSKVKIDYACFMTPEIRAQIQEIYAIDFQSLQTYGITYK